MRNLVLLTGTLLGLAACTTVPDRPAPDRPASDSPASGGPTSDTQSEPVEEAPAEIVIAQPKDILPAPPSIPAPPPPTSEPPLVTIYETPSGFERLAGWNRADLRPGLSAFARGCESWAQADQLAALSVNLPEYGRYIDWSPACAEAAALAARQVRSYEIRAFMERYFTPVDLSAQTGGEGLLTGYYEPEINVRLMPGAGYSEPILAKPDDPFVQNLPRSKLSAASSRVIAYGRPIDVFFMQVQGSGRIKFSDGRVMRAAYGGNNGKLYKSIGRVLIDRGEMTKEQASKQAIEDWMMRKGPAAARELMNQNPRYIFFAEQAIAPGEGPRGSMRVPLTEMGSIAVDNRYHPYGTLMWLETTLPRFGGDYRGEAGQLLVTAQDSGNAIKGPLRGDLFFGAGKAAGDKAGVMKHPVRWTIFLPKSLAPGMAGPS